jgi:TolB protein
MRYIQSLIVFFITITIFHSLPVYAELAIEVTGAGEHQIPISIVPFAGEDKLDQSISTIVSADLQRSGLFKLIAPANRLPHELKEVAYSDWAGIDTLSIGSVEASSKGRVKVKFKLLDAVRQSELLSQTILVENTEIRAAAHHIADLIFERVTGDPGVFSTRIAYINRQKNGYQLVTADCDGYDEKIIYSSDSIIMSPAWSPDGSHLAFVAFEQDHTVVYIQSMLTNQRMMVANFPESNTAPTWSPNGRELAFVLTNDGSSHIYLVHLDGSNLQQITFDDEIDTEPDFSPDGQSLIFASDRGGRVQIYRISIDDGAAERLTFDGGSNFSPHYSPDGKSFAYSSWIDGKFYIVTEDIQSKQVQVLTNGDWDKNPSFAPNGKMILFASEIKGRGVLATVSIDGRVRQKIFAQTGNIHDPTWGPLIKSSF